MSKSNEKGKKTINQLQLEILEEAKRIARNETTSCYILSEKTKELIAVEKFLREA